MRRNVLERHPALHAATRQEIEAEDEQGRKYRFAGHAIAMAAIPARLANLRTNRSRMGPFYGGRNPKRRDGDN